MFIIAFLYQTHVKTPFQKKTECLPKIKKKIFPFKKNMVINIPTNHLVNPTEDLSKTTMFTLLLCALTEAYLTVPLNPAAALGGRTSPVWVVY